MRHCSLGDDDFITAAFFRAIYIAHAIELSQRQLNESSVKMRMRFITRYVACVARACQR